MLLRRAGLTASAGLSCLHLAYKRRWLSKAMMYCLVGRVLVNGD